MTETIVDFLEPVAVEKQNGHTLIEFLGIAQRANQAAFEKRTVRQPGEAVVAGLMRQGFVFALKMGLPGLEFIEQGIEVVAQVVELGDIGRWHTAVEGSIASGGVGNCSKAAQWARYTPKLSARQIKGDPGADGRA